MGGRQRPLHAEEASLHIRRILILLGPYHIRASFSSPYSLPICEVSTQAPCREGQRSSILSIAGQTLD